MADPNSAELEDEFEEMEEYEDEEEMMEEETDPDFTPGDAEDDEEEGSAGDDASLDELSDTNAPYAEEPAAASSKKGGLQLGNPLKLVGKLRPRSLMSALRGQRQRLQRLVWKLEDASVFTAKVAVKAVVKGARPVLVWLVVARALRTIDRSEDLGLRMMKQPAHKQIDYYYSNLLGEDWKEQIEQDFVAALAEVDGGYITDEMVRERRGLQASILRRLEVEEWDKERMRHFYYGLYGLGPWYWDMEERLHNPFFIGARGWNGSPESWINENQVFPNDIDAARRDFRIEVAERLGASRGKALSTAATKKLMAAEEVRGVEQVLSSRLFKGAVRDPQAVRQQLEQQQQQAAAV